MTSNAIFLAQEALSVAALGLALCFWFAMRRAQAQVALARVEMRRLNEWGQHWFTVAEGLSAIAALERWSRSRRASHARQAQIAQRRAKVAETAEKGAGK